MPTDAKYATIEGHPIVRDGEYETRGGARATVIGFTPDIICGFISYPITSPLCTWGFDGLRRDVRVHDLMRPWPDQKSEGIAEGLVAEVKEPEEKKPYCQPMARQLSAVRIIYCRVCAKPITSQQARECSGLPEEKKPEKQTYKLSEMWIAWEDEGDNRISQSSAFTVLQSAQTYAKHVDALALTRADATEFYEGEGLETGDK